MTDKLKPINCPVCNTLMEIVLRKTNNSFIQFECRNCLAFWELKKYDMTDEEVRELAQL